MNMSKNNNTMIISLNNEYRKMLVSVLNEYDNIDGEIVNDILSAWDSKVDESVEGLVSIVGTQKKTRKGRKTTGPKRPISAYLYFCKEKRAEVKEENPNMKATEITSELGRLWHEVKETEEVEQYNELAKADRARYNAEVEEAQVESGGNESKGEEKAKKKKRVTKKGGPKRPKSAYLYFCEEKRAEVKEENPDMKPTEVTSELGRLWNKIKDTKAALKYKEQAEDAKAQYAEAVASGDESSKEENPKKGKKFPKAKESGTPKGIKLPKTGYQLFCNESDETDKKELKRQWLEMKKNDVERFQDYNIRVAEMKIKNYESSDEKVEENPIPEPDRIVLPMLSFNQTQEPEAKAEPEDELDAEEEADAQMVFGNEDEDQAEEDPILVDTRAILTYLEEIKGNRPGKDEFLEQLESFENLSSEIKDYIEKIKKLRTMKTVSVAVVEKMTIICKDTIKSYEL